MDIQIFFYINVCQYLLITSTKSNVILTHSSIIKRSRWLDFTYKNLYLSYNICDFVNEQFIDMYHMHDLPLKAIHLSYKGNKLSLKKNKLPWKTIIYRYLCGKGPGSLRSFIGIYMLNVIDILSNWILHTPIA